jgi:ABC-2 type transport system ATP-binding protein
MSSNEGFFELQAEDCDLLIQILNTHPAIESIKKKRKRFCISKSPLEAAALNKFL